MTQRGIQKTVFKYLLPVAVAALLMWTQPPAVAQQPANLPTSIAFEWDANSETNLAFYVCAIQSPGGSLTNVVKANVTTARFDPMPSLPTPWTVTVRAVNVYGISSEPSVPCIVTAPMRTVGLRAVVTIELNATGTLKTGTTLQDGTQSKVLGP